MDWCGSHSFFSKKRELLIENFSSEPQIERTNLFGSYNMIIDETIDVRQAIKRIQNARYRMVIEQLDLHDVAPEDLAKNMGITVDNLYNIHRRALLQLKLIMVRKEDYV